jgi:hypothetical protein
MSLNNSYKSCLIPRDKVSPKNKMPYILYIQCKATKGYILFFFTRNDYFFADGSGFVNLIRFWRARFIQKLVNEAARCVFYYLTCAIHYAV